VNNRRRGGGGRQDAGDSNHSSAAAAYLKTHQNLSPFETEINQYVTMMDDMFLAQRLATNPLMFWAKNKHMLPILARFARRFLSPACTSCNVEEFFSIICSPTRSRLTPDLLKCLSCLYGWKREELIISDSRVAKRLKAAEQFAILSVTMEIIPAEADETVDTLQGDVSEALAEEYEENDNNEF
jgi:hypothetical protein